MLKNFIKLFVKREQEKTPSFLYPKGFKAKDNKWQTSYVVPNIEENLEYEEKIDEYRKASELINNKFLKELLDHILDSCATDLIQTGVSEQDMFYVQGMATYKSIIEQELYRMDKLYENRDVVEQFDKYKVI